MIPLHDIAMIAAGMAMSAFFSGSETGAYVMNRIRLRHRSLAGDRRASMLESLLHDPSSFVTAILLWNNIANYLVTAAMIGIIINLDLNVDPDVAAFAVTTPLLFFFCELAPKDLYRQRADSLMLVGARPLWWVVTLVRPVARLMAGAGRILREIFRLAEPRDWALVTRRAVSEHLAEVAQLGGFSGPQRYMADSILQAASRPVREVGVPVSRCVLMRSSDTVADVLARAGELTSSRLPVLDETSGALLGTIHLLRAWGQPHGRSVAELVSPPVWIPRDVSVMQALTELRRSRTSIGFIPDGDASPAAVVTVEGLLKQILPSPTWPRRLDTAGKVG